MKSKTLISCILLSTVILLLFSMVSKATEYREVNTEVKADDILKHIEKGDDINLANCHIVGKLNLSKIDLKKVFNPRYQELHENKYKGMAFPSGDSVVCVPLIHESDEEFEKLKVVESNITILCCTIEDNLDFSYSLFKKPLLFDGSIFLSQAVFTGSHFENNTYFEEATYCTCTFGDKPDVFNNTTNIAFIGEKDFRAFLSLRDNLTSVSYSIIGVDFKDTADFSSATFDNNTTFHSTTFRNHAKFYNVVFNGNSDFKDATFNNDSYFFWSNFNNTADFSDVTFENAARFRETIFNKDVYFSDVTFKNVALFDKTIFNKDVYFSDTTFNDSASFFDATFENVVNFMGVTFKDTALFNSNFNNSAKFTGPRTSENIVTNGEDNQILIKYYKDQGHYEDADNIYYNYRNKIQEEKEWNETSKWIDLITWITCGYGVKPLFSLRFGIAIIFLFTGIYSNLICLKKDIYKKVPIIRPCLNLSFDKISNKMMPKLSLKKPGIINSDHIREGSLLDIFYFSVCKFTFMSYENWYPRDNFRVFAIIEGVIGWATLGIFMATLTAVMIRL